MGEVSTIGLDIASMRFVPIKSEQQQSGLMLHRSRQLLVRQRATIANAIRSHMRSSASSRPRGATAGPSCWRSLRMRLMTAFQQLHD